MVNAILAKRVNHIVAKGDNPVWPKGSKSRGFSTYLGLVPTSHSSGGKIAHGEKTFRGNKKLGPQIVEASWVSIYRDSGLGCAYVNYKKRMEPQEAIIRIARKLSNIIFSVLKTGRKYEPYECNKFVNKIKLHDI